MRKLRTYEQELAELKADCAKLLKMEANPIKTLVDANFILSSVIEGGDIPSEEDILKYIRHLRERASQAVAEPNAFDNEEEEQLERR